MPGSPTTPGRPGTRARAPVRVAFRAEYRVGPRDISSFAAQWLAYALPYRRFARNLAAADARLGSDVDRSGRIEARTGLRMMPTFPRSSLSFRTAGFPQYGWKAGLSDGLFRNAVQLKPAPGIRCSSSSLRPSFVHFVAASIAPL
jgi:hypothetical protein